MKVSADIAKALAKPAISLPRYGKIVDLQTSQIEVFDSTRLTYKCQDTIVGYMSDPPLTDTGETVWVCVLKGRQTGGSTTGALCLYPPVAYQPGVNAGIIADRKKRADYLFDRINLCDKYWPDDIRTPRENTNETRALTTEDGSKLIVMSAESEAVGIGLSLDYLMGSELPFWTDAGTQLSMIQPAMMNRLQSRLMLESTPAPLSEPSGQWWMDHWADAVRAKGRFRGAFFPFWDSKANVRPWPKGSAVTVEELRLLERFGKTDQWGHPGLTLENLAFRRWVMDSDAKIRRNPDLFGVFYPFDDVSCWIAQGLGVVPVYALDRHLQHDLHPEEEDYTEFRPPNPDAVYVIGVDPSGYGRDHAAFQVIEVWDDEWVQVASYGAVTDPNIFAQKLFDTGIRYNKAKICIERNGPGVAQTALLRHMKYPNLHYDGWGKPGVHKSNQEEWLSLLVDALLDKLTLLGRDTVMQTKGYRHDRMNERTMKAEILRPGNAGRRARHHWDKVSALMVACAVAPSAPRRYKRVEKPGNVLLFQEMTWDQHVEYIKKVESLKLPAKRRIHYRRR